MIFLGLGSNIGDRLKMLNTAIEKIAGFCEIIDRSPVYETKPWGIKEQQNFYNIAIAIKTDLTPAETLVRCLDIETRMGRVRIEEWGERNIDIDIILWKKRIIETPFLTIPHAYLSKRDFFLKPCIDIDENAIDPKTRLTFKELLDSLTDKDLTIIREIDA